MRSPVAWSSSTGAEIAYRAQSRLAQLRRCRAGSRNSIFPLKFVSSATNHSHGERNGRMASCCSLQMGVTSHDRFTMCAVWDSVQYCSQRCKTANKQKSSGRTATALASAAAASAAVHSSNVAHARAGAATPHLQFDAHGER